MAFGTYKMVAAASGQAVRRSEMAILSLAICLSLFGLHAGRVFCLLCTRAGKPVCVSFRLAVVVVAVAVVVIVVVAVACLFACRVCRRCCRCCCDSSCSSASFNNLSVARLSALCALHLARCFNVDSLMRQVMLRL